MNGQELQQIRKETLRLRQDEFGSIIGHHSTTISDWEREGREIPRYAALIARLMADDPVLREKVIAGAVEKRSSRKVKRVAS